MGKIGKILLVALFFCPLFSGCANISPLSPELNQKIDNQNGKIEELKNIQNGLNAEIGKLRNDTSIQNSQIKDLQQGALNVKLEGDGALILVFSTIVIFMLLVYQFLVARKNAKTADMLAEQIVRKDDPETIENVFKACMYTNVESDVYKLIKKHQKRFNH